MVMRRADYPDNWEELSYYVRFVRACGRCEGSPAYPDCRAQHGKPHPVTGSKVILTTAHLGVDRPDGSPGSKHDKLDCRLENLAAMCQRCHLFFDLADHIANRKRNALRRRAEAGQLLLVALERTLDLNGTD